MIVAALHPIPKYALLPMIIIFFGLGETSRIDMGSIGTYFPMVVYAMTGVVQINPIYYEVIEDYKASRFDVFRKVVLPGSPPFGLSGACLSLRSSMTITIGVEMVFGNMGLGSRLWLGLGDHENGGYVSHPFDHCDHRRWHVEPARMVEKILDTLAS